MAPIKLYLSSDTAPDPGPPGVVAVRVPLTGREGWRPTGLALDSALVALNSNRGRVRGQRGGAAAQHFYILCCKLALSQSQQSFASHFS